MLALAVATAPVRLGQQRTLRFRVMYNEYQDEFFQRCASDFEELHPEIDVVIERVTGGSWTDFEISLLNDFWNGTPPDITRINDSFLTRLINADLLDRAPDDLAGFLDAQPVSDAMKEILRRGDKVYGLVHAATWQGLFYNRDHFREAGLDPDRPPETLAELLDYARRLTRYDEDGNVLRAGLSLRKSGYAPGTAMKFFDFFFSEGGELFDESMERCLLNSDAGVRALQFYLDVLYGEPRADGFEVVGDAEGFANGTVSMFYRGPWVMKFLSENAPDINYGVGNICAGVRSASNGGLYPLVVASQSAERELGWEFVRFMLEEERQAQYARKEMQAPWGVDLSDWPEFAENEAFTVFMRQENVLPFPYIPHQNEISAMIGDTIERVARTGEDPKEALDALVAQIDPLLKEREGKEGVSPKLVSGILLGALALGFLAYVIVWWRRDPVGRGAYLLLAPMLVYFALFFIYPIVSSLILSFWDYNPLEPIHPFIGFANYLDCLNDEVFLKSLGNTVVYAFWTVALGTILSLALALVLNRALEAVGLYRTLYFIPVVTSIMGAVLVWKFLYRPDAAGLFNRVLETLGFDSLLWLQDERLALGCLIGMAIWKNLGFNMIIFLAGLKAIPGVYYEAAAIDGASGWQAFRHITLPALRPTVLFVLVTSLIGTFQVFTQVVGMTEGGPNNATRTIVYHIYEVGFKDFQLGYASAAAVVMLVIVGFITWVQMRIARD